MAPSSKGTNPAPNYAVTMNRVQTQIEARLRIVRSFMPSRSAAPNTSSSTSHPITGTSKPPPPSFSALASTSKPNPPNLKSRQRTQEQDAAAESLFAETRAQDPNAGLGFRGSSKRSGEREKEKEKERENQILRSRLLGRKRGAGDRTSSRRGERSDDDDEEPGRSGLGRAKKRARREESRESREEEEEEEEEEEKGGEAEILPPVTEPETLESANSAGKVGATQSMDDGLENATLEEEGEKDGRDVDVRDGQGVAADSVPNSSEGASEQKKSKKRKRKKRKNKSKEAEGE
ncbi:hypothetical protein F5B21DRAFT_235930 [Xylaria acuta]|nr:hypothetical protein F5B21DRAFT_235930 [Xylaria acuta]